MEMSFVEMLDIDRNRLNRQLVTRLLVDGTGGKGDSKNTAGKVADEQ